MASGTRRKRIDRGIKVRSDSIYVLAAPGDIAYLAAPRLLLVGALLLLPVGLAPWPYWERVALSACVMALLAIGIDFLAYGAGLLCLGGAFLFGVGSYAAALLRAELGLPLVLSVPLAALLGAALCTLAIYPCLPLRGIYFAVVTLMYPLLMTRLIEALDVLGGTEGWHGIPGFASAWVEAYALVGCVLAALFGLRRYASSDAGLVIRAVKDDDQAVRAAGIDPTRCRARALFIGSFLGCLAGAYYTHMYGTAGVSSFALDLSIVPIAATVLGGGGSLYGALAGCFFLVPLGELLRDFGSLRIAGYGLILALFVVYRSEGLVPWAARRYQQLEKRVQV